MFGTREKFKGHGYDGGRMKKSSSGDKAVIRSTALAVNRIRPSYEQVAAQLRDLIVQRSLEPGDRLPSEAELAAAFGVGRGTIREALRVLTSRDMVRVVRGAAGGSFVAEADPASITDYLETGIGLLRGDDAITLRELLESRLLLEVPAAKLAAERRTDEHVAALRASLAWADGADDHFDHNQHFHALILDAADNRLLSVMTLPVFGVIRSRYVIPRGAGRFWEDVDSDHQEIMGHIVIGDAEAAGASMHSHLLKLNDIYRQIEEERSHDVRLTTPIGRE